MKQFARLYPTALDGSVSYFASDDPLPISPTILGPISLPGYLHFVLQRWVRTSEEPPHCWRIFLFLLQQ